MLLGAFVCHAQVSAAVSAALRPGQARQLTGCARRRQSQQTFPHSRQACISASQLLWYSAVCYILTRGALFGASQFTFIGSTDIVMCMCRLASMPQR